MFLKAILVLVGVAAIVFAIVRIGMLGIQEKLTPRRAARILGTCALTFVFAFGLAMTIYTVEEGHIGVIKRWEKAVAQVGPGIHVKWPISDSVEYIEVRQRKNVEELAAATANQLKITAKVSINWTVNRDSAMQLFIDYGGLGQFETRILDPKLRSAAKAALSKFPADELIRNRQAAVAVVMENMTDALETFPVTVNSPQIENIVFPDTYMAAVLAKEQARENAEREKHNLERQRLEALQAVNSAEANAKSKRLGAEAEAYRVLTEATAEAQAIKLVTEQLITSPAYIDLMRVKRWDGKVPRTVLSDQASVLIGLNK